jgi:hypothetical protein
MARTEGVVSLDGYTLLRLDRLVAGAVFPSGSRAIQVAVGEKLTRLAQDRLARECAKLDPGFEKALAGEGVSEGSAEWPTCREATYISLTSIPQEVVSRRGGGRC